MNRRLKFGIEEEYFITDLQTRCMPDQPSTEVVAACQALLGKHFAHEMFQCQIEMASPIFRDLPEAADYLAQVRTGLTQRSEEHTSELQSLMRISYAVFCLKKKTKNKNIINNQHKHSKDYN